MITLTDEQTYAIELFKQWFYNKNKSRMYFEITGPPGSGKSTLVHYMIAALQLKQIEVLYVTYTGKAALNLTLKGCPTKTIHSTIFETKKVNKKDANGNTIKNGNESVKEVKFVKKSELNPLISLIVVDEGSMVDQKLAGQLLSFNIPLIVLGDLDQLKPIKGRSFFLEDPDIKLTQILRQRAGDPIITLSQMIINNEIIKTGKYGDNCFVINKESITDKLLKTVDIIICGKNKTRSNLNRYIRRDIYKRGSSLEVGDKLICRKNNWNINLNEDIYLINGLIGYVTSILSEDKYEKSYFSDINFKPDFLSNSYFEDIKIDLRYLHEEDMSIKQNYIMEEDGNLFEYGYAITSHLSQGSQYRNVLVYNESFGSHDNYRRMLYTAVTRAEKGLILAI